MNNFWLFLADLKSYGVLKITPTTVLVEDWSLIPLPAPTTVTRSQSCPGSPQLVFVPWLPFGLDPNDSYYPDRGGLYNALTNPYYNCSPFPPGTFWGWQPLLNLVGWIAAGANNYGITIEEFDLQNEVNLTNFTVTGRLIYDNTTNTNVFALVQQALSNYSINPSILVTSVQKRSPSEQTPSDCGSVYGDSAMLMDLSEFIGATGGAAIGVPPYVSYNGNAPCVSSAQQTQCRTPQTNPSWQACVTAGMITIAGVSGLGNRSLIDVHAIPSCLYNAQNVCESGTGYQSQSTSIATTFYGDFLSFANYRQLTTATLMFGEFPNAQPAGCDGEALDWATWSVSGYFPSSLFTNAASRTVMRPWENSVESCYTIPALIGAPSGPFTR